MRKFKVKNRPKRKYIRKANLPERDSLTRTAWFGFVPLSIIAISLFSTTLIMNPFITKGLSSIEIPHEITHAIAQPFHITAKTISTTRLPHVTLPKIDSSPIERFFTGLGNTLTKFFVTSMILLGQLIVSGITQIAQATFKLFQWIVATIIYLSQLFIKGFFWMITTITTFVSQCIRILGDITLTIFRGIVWMIVSVGHAIIASSTSVSRWFISVMNSVGNAISSFFTAVINVIKVPFIALGKLYKVVEPGLLYVVRSFADSTNALLRSLASIINATSQLTKK